MNLLKFAKRYLPSMLITFLLMLPWVLIDLTYNGLITFTVALSILGGIRTLARCLGLNYGAAFKILSGSLGVLVTVFSLFITMTNNIAERSEKKIFGISRKRIGHEGMPGALRYISRTMKMTTCLAPLLMVACIIEGWCVSGYALLLYCYGFLTINYYYHSRTYSNSYNIHHVVSIIKESMDESLRSEDAYRSHQVMLNEFGSSVRSNAEWTNAESLYFELTDRVIEEDSESLCVVCGDFFRKGYVEVSHENSVYLLQKFICKLDAAGSRSDIGDDGTDEKEFRGYVLMWSMLCSWMDSVEEVTLLRFLKWFLEFDARSGENIRNGAGAIDQRLLDRQSVMMLVLLERWLNEHTPENVEMVEIVRRVQAISRNALLQDEEFWIGLSDVYAEMRQKEYKVFEDFEECKERLRSDAYTDTNITMVKSLSAIE